MLTTSALEREAVKMALKKCPSCIEAINISEFPSDPGLLDVTCVDDEGELETVLVSIEECARRIRSTL